MNAEKYPPLFPFTRRYFNLPANIESNNQILVFFLFTADSAKRSEVLKQIKSGDDEPWPVNLQQKELAAIPWLRNFKPSVDCIFQISRNTEYGYVSSESCIFVDKVGLEEGTVVASHYLSPKAGQDDDEQEAARVPISKARKLLCEASREKSWFPDTVKEACRIREEIIDEGWEEQNLDHGWKCPMHLAEDWKLNKERPIIISLIHLSDAELDLIKAEISTNHDYPEIEIINWPAQIEPASEIDMWHIADRMKPDWSTVAPYGQIFAFFISSAHLTGPERRPRLVVAQREQLVPRQRSDLLDPQEFSIENTMHMWFCETRRFWRAWHAAWNPTGSATCYDVRENDAMRQLWNDRTLLYSFADVVNPEVAMQVTRCEIPVFLLQPISASQEYALRSLLNMENDPQLIHIPGAGTIRELVKYFQSPAWVCYQKRPPSNFIAVDAQTLSSWDPATQTFILGEMSILLATMAIVWHYDSHHNMIARDDVGYAVGRTTMHDEDDYQQWNGWVLSTCGLGNYIEDYNGDGEDVERYYWDCFDVDNKELQSLVSTMS